MRVETHGPDGQRREHDEDEQPCARQAAPRRAGFREKRSAAASAVRDFSSAGHFIDGGFAHKKIGRLMDFGRGRLLAAAAEKQHERQGDDEGDADIGKKIVESLQRRLAGEDLSRAVKARFWASCALAPSF